MSNREIVIELLAKLPEDTSLHEIAREIEFLAGIETARQQARCGEGIPAEDARKLIETWAALHAVRTALGALATAIFLWASLA